MKNATMVALVLDRSGSIGSCLRPMQDMLDEFINGQKAVPGECDFLLAQFDDVYDIVYRGPIKDAPKHKIIPRGSTALVDAIGRTINSVGAELKARPEHERPNKVVICIVTDGWENASMEFEESQVAGMVQHQKDAYQWNFVYLGANQDAIFNAKKFNIAAANTMVYAASAGGVRGMSVGVNSYVTRARNFTSAETMNANNQFTQEEKDAAEDKKPKASTGK